MSNLPRAYRKYHLLFTPKLIPHLRDLRGDEWAKLIDRLAVLPETHPDALAFSMMMIDLNNCLNCEMDNYRAQRGCVLCARQTIINFKGTDQKLLNKYEQARQTMTEQWDDGELQQAA